MTYERFAYVYDHLMKDAPYDKWLYLVISRMEKYGIKDKSVLDLACGTGEFTIELANHGFAVSGVDLSEEMLTVASGKAIKQGLNIPFYQQNMVELTGLGMYDCVTIFCDSINYIRDEADVLNTFSQVYHHLHKGALFMFDVHSIYKVEHVLKNQTFSISDEEISYIWDCFPGEEQFSVEHELSFFVLDQDTGKYDRFNELHYQRTYPSEKYIEWLESTGFEVLEILSDLEDEPVHEQTERIMFVARKK
jgi:2-polyprenyl-3-methyl-5-hydroxy-6-metoxy-1,4-benzoquinol methylase